MIIYLPRWQLYGRKVLINDEIPSRLRCSRDEGDSGKGGHFLRKRSRATSLSENWGSPFSELSPLKDQPSHGARKRGRNPRNAAAGKAVGGNLSLMNEKCLDF